MTEDGGPSATADNYVWQVSDWERNWFAENPNDLLPSQKTVLLNTVHRREPRMEVATIALMAVGDVDQARLLRPGYATVLEIVRQGAAEEFLRDTPWDAYAFFNLPVLIAFEAVEDAIFVMAILRSRCSTDV